MKDKKDVIALAVGNTYDIVTRTSVTAHPARAPYPRASFSLLIPIQKGGYMEEIYDVLSIVECLPQDVEKQKVHLAASQYALLERYHELRSKTFGYSDKDGMYRFYIMSNLDHSFDCVTVLYSKQYSYNCRNTDSTTNQFCLVFLDPFLCRSFFIFVIHRRKEMRKRNSQKKKFSRFELIV